MNNITKFIKSSLLAVLLITAASCEKELDVAPMLTFDGTANMTIAELLTYHDIGSVDSFDSIPAGTIITGTIVSSDEHGNCYKYITVQDATAGIQIKFENTSSYPKYKIGQKVYVKCDGLVIGDYRKNPQLGWWANGAMAGISTAKESLYIFRDGEAGPEPAPIVITSKNEIDPAIHCNRLVRLDNCHFEDAGIATYASENSSESRNIVMGDGTIIILRTSNYADFALTTLPEGVGSIYGILTAYTSSYQLTIRSLGDVRFLGPVYSVDFSQDLLQNGWTNQVINGAAWSYGSFQGTNFMKVEATDSDNDSWLISPAINLTSYSNVTLSFDHQANVANTSNLKLYYSTTYTGGEINSAQWTEIAIPNYPISNASTDILLDNSIIANPNLRFAYRYAAEEGNWYIQRIDFRAIVAQ